MQEHSSNIILSFIFFVLSFLGQCHDPATQVIPPVYKDGGFELTLAPQEDLSEAALEQTLTVLTKRLDYLNPELQFEEGEFLLALPSSSSGEQERIIQLVTQPGELAFRLVKESSGGVPDLTSDDLEPSAFTQTIIAGATVSTDSYTGPVVDFEILAEFQADFESFTAANTGRRLAITLDSKVLISPTIMGAIHGGGQISGLDSQAEAEDLARVLNAGPLPVPLELVDISVTPD